MIRSLAQAARAVLQQSLLIAAIAVAVFLLIRVVPGDVVDSMALEGSLDDDAIAALRAEHARIEERLETQRAIGVAIPASAVVRAVAQALPEGALLERIGLDYANVQGTNKKIRRGAKDEVQARELRGEIAGIAANEADVGRIVDGLAALAPMSQVSLESSRSREFNGRNVREFRIDFRVDLEKRWKLSEVAQGETP